MAKINVRSPYYVSITAANLSSVDMQLYIYSGTQVTDRTSGTLFNLRSTAISNISTFEIGEVVKDYIANTFEGDYTNLNIWVDYRTINNFQGTSTPPSAYTLLTGFYGYGYFEDGANPQLNEQYLQTNRTILKWKDEPLRIPVDTSRTGFVVFTNFEGGNSATYLTPSDQSDGQIAYVYSDGSTFGSYESRVLSDGGTIESSECLNSFFDNIDPFDVDTVYIINTGSPAVVDTIKVQDIEECKYQPYKLTFENRYGALQDIWFFKRTNEKLATTKETFKRNIIVNGTYNTSRHQTKILTKNGVEKLTLNTGFYPELYNEVFKELQLSENVWIEFDNKVLPVNIDSGGFDYKTSLNDKLINYTIDVSFAFDTINNIR